MESFNFLNSMNKYEIRYYIKNNELIFESEIQNITKKDIKKRIMKTYNINTKEYFENIVFSKSDKELYEFFNKYNFKFYFIKENKEVFLLISENFYETSSSIYIIFYDGELKELVKNISLLKEKETDYIFIDSEKEDKYYEKIGFKPKLIKFNKILKKDTYNRTNIEKVIINSGKIQCEKNKKIEIIDIINLQLGLEEEDYEHDLFQEEKIDYSKINYVEASKNFYKMIDNKNVEIYVYIQDNLPVGYIKINKLPKINKIHIHCLYIKKEYRGQGISRKLINFIEQIAFQNGYKSCSICALGGNYKAKEIYSKHFGFNICNVRYGIKI